MPSLRPAPETCANCGAVIPRHARACPECGADERTGWREISIYDGLALPDAAFTDPTQSFFRRNRHRLKWYWLAAALLVLITLIGGTLALR